VSLIGLTSRPGEAGREVIEQDVAFVEITDALSLIGAATGEVTATADDEDGAGGRTGASMSCLVAPCPRTP
jgi:hypothetical protein